MLYEKDLRSIFAQLLEKVANKKINFFGKIFCAVLQTGNHSEN